MHYVKLIILFIKVWKEGAVHVCAHRTVHTLLLRIVKLILVFFCQKQLWNDDEYKVEIQFMTPKCMSHQKPFFDSFAFVAFMLLSHYWIHPFAHSQEKLTPSCQPWVAGSRDVPVKDPHFYVGLMQHQEHIAFVWQGRHFDSGWVNRSASRMGTLFLLIPEEPHLHACTGGLAFCFMHFVSLPWFHQ